MYKLTIANDLHEYSLSLIIKFPLKFCGDFIIMHEYNEGRDNASFNIPERFSTGRLPSNFRIPGGMEMSPHEKGYRMLMGPSMDAQSHGILEREFFSYHPDDRPDVLSDYQALFPTAVFVPDNHLFLVAGGKPRFGLVEGVVPITNKEFILNEDPNVIGFHSNMMGGDEETDTFFEYYIRQPESSMTHQELLITVGIRLASNDFGSINDEIKRLREIGHFNETRMRELIDPYMRIRVRPIQIEDNNDHGGESIESPRPTPPKYPDGQFAYAEEDIV